MKLILEDFDPLCEQIPLMEGSLMLGELSLELLVLRGALGVHFAQQLVLLLQLCDTK